MTPEAFRTLAVSFPRAQERLMLGSQEFRVKDKAFATLGWPEAGSALLRLTPKDQARFMRICASLTSEPGGRGKRGITRLRLAGADPATISAAVRAAWEQVGGKALDLA